MTDFGRKKAANTATEQPAREENEPREQRETKRTEKLRKYNCICELQESVQLLTIMLPVWEATLDEIESKLLE